MTRMESRMARTPTARVAARQAALRDVIEAHRPLTVRRAFYIAVTAGLYPKTDHGYELVIEDSNVLRDQGIVDYAAVIDPTRDMLAAELWPTPADAARWYARHLRIDPWDEMPSRLAVTCESEGLAVALFEHLERTPLRVIPVKGNSGSPAVVSLAEWLAPATDAAVVLHVGDADGQGMAIEDDLRSRLALHADRLGGIAPTVERVWLSREQAIAAGVPSRPAKLTPMDLRYGFASECWEAEAGDPATIARLVTDRADALLDAGVLASVAERERVARVAFADLASRLAA